MKSFLLFLSEAENWENQLMGDDSGRQYSVKQIYEYAKSKPEFFNAALPIDQTDALEWWDKSYSMDNPNHVSRMMNADTSYPILVIKDKNSLSVADGLNRTKKAHAIEGKKTLPAYIVPKEHIAKFAVNT